MKNKYFIILSYSGTNYHGWQMQANARTVQETIEKSISLVLNDIIELTGAGRTDAGVHASYFVAHFSTRKNFQEDKLVFKLNNFLPKDIVIHKIMKMHEDAHARFSAITRTYRYIITQRKNPFLQDQAFQYYGNLSHEKMNETCNYIRGNHEFTSFSKLHSNNKTDYCDVHYSKWIKSGNYLIFTITANRFLRNMVRSLVGTMLNVGKEKITPSDFSDILQSRDRSLASTSAPAKGLYLTDIKYPAEFLTDIEHNEILFPFLI